MNRLRIIYFIGLFLFIFASCGEDEDLIVDVPQSFPNLKSGAIEIDACNDSPTVFELIAGKHMDVGDVIIVNDEENLYLTYETDGEWMLEAVHAFVGLLEDVPVNKKNTPIPGHFPYKDCNLLTQSHTFVIPLSFLGEGECVVVLAHAVVVRNEMCDRGEMKRFHDMGKIKKVHETAWGNGGMDFKETFDTRRWGYLGEYCVQDCKDKKYLTFQSFYMSSGTEAATHLSDGLQLYSSGWCLDLGLVRPVDGATYDLLKFGRYGKIGNASINVDDDELLVTLSLDDQASEFTKTYVFYGTLEELADYEVVYCPNYLAFPNQILDTSNIHQISLLY